MTNQRRQVICLVAELRGIHHCPEEDYGFGHWPDRRALGNDQQTCAGLPSRQVVAEVMEHRPTVMGHQYPVGHCCPFQEIGIFDASELGIGG